MVWKEKMMLNWFEKSNRQIYYGILITVSFHIFVVAFQ